jgi:magnesium transporter
MRAFIVVDGKIEQTTSHQVVREAQLAQRPLWVDLGPRSAESDVLLAETFRLHPLVIEDIWLDSDLPKIDDLGDYLYVVVHGPRIDGEKTRSRLMLWVLDLVIGPTFLITHHDDAALEKDVVEHLMQSPGLLAEGPARLTHRLIDQVIDRFQPVIQHVGSRLDEVETEVIDGALKGKEQELTQVLFRLKRTIQSLCRISRHQHKLLARLAEGGVQAIPKESLPYFRDVSEHFERVSDLAETYQDTVLAILSAYLSVQSNVMNQAVRRLTVISTVLLPLNLIAGIFGMNFPNIPGMSWRYGYMVVLASMVALAAMVLAWARHKRWL